MTTPRNPLTSVDAAYLQNECNKLDIKVTIAWIGATPVLHIMDGEFHDFSSALRFVQAYQAEQGARWASYKPRESSTEVPS